MQFFVRLHYQAHKRCQIELVRVFSGKGEKKKKKSSRIL